MIYSNFMDFINNIESLDTTTIRKNSFKHESDFLTYLSIDADTLDNMSIREIKEEIIKQKAANTANDLKVVYEKSILVGDFCSLDDKSNHKVENINEAKYHLVYHNGFACNLFVTNTITIKGKRKRNVSFYGISFLKDKNENQHHDLFGFLGNVKIVSEGFIAIPVHGESAKVFRNEKLAKDYLYQVKFNRTKEATFGELAKKEFGFTKNYLLDENGVMSIEHLTNICLSLYGSYYKENKEIAKQYAELYLSSNIIGVKGQSGYLVAA